MKIIQCTLLPSSLEYCKFNRSYHHETKSIKMTSASPSPLLLLVASAALAWSSAEGFIHPPSQTSPLQMQMHHTRHAQHCRLSNQLNLSNSVENDIETATPLNDLPLHVVLASDLNTSLETTIPDTRSEEAKNMLAMEMSEVGPEGIMPFAPMMTFQKFLTMQVCVCCVF
jgi:hypothetical protein